MPQILLQKHSVLTLYLQVNTKLFVIITLQLCVSPCLALIAEGNRACFIMPINWVNWLILISCFLNLMRDSASLGKHIILQQDQKQRKPVNKSFGFQRMFTGKLSVFWPELGQTTGFASVCWFLCLLCRWPRKHKQNWAFPEGKLPSAEYKLHVLCMKR